MRWCRFQQGSRIGTAWYEDSRVLPVRSIAESARAAGLSLPPVGDLGDSGDMGDDGLLLSLLPHGSCADWGVTVAAAVRSRPEVFESSWLPAESVQLLVPIHRPNKIFLLAGNYAEHVAERGGVPETRENTFPYVFMKPPSTTLNDPYRPVSIPSVAPDAVDWELELAVVIGKSAKRIAEADALQYVAGYTIINDITQRKYRPNPGRTVRERDKFFDWLHGKWFDGFCPCGPCVTAADPSLDPQALPMKLTLNGAVRQDSSTAKMVFPVAAVIAFISQMVTLEPGDLISTGTPSGVGSATGTYLKPGDRLVGTIDRIGTLTTVIGAVE